MNAASLSPSTTRLTAVMCNYNHGQYVGRAIEAVVSQSRPPDEFIIVDDGSTDHSVAVIESFTRIYPYIRLIKNERNIGVMASVQRANDLITGDYIYWGAADDYILPGFFSRAMDLAARYPEAGGMVGICTIVESSGKELGQQAGPGWPDSSYIGPQQFLQDYLRKVPPTHSFVSAVILKKQSFLAVGGYKYELGFWIDTFALRAIGLRFGICYIDQPCALWHAMPGSFCLSTTKDPKKELTILDNLVDLMTSPEFRDYFPADYVAQWSADYRNEIIAKALARVESAFAEIHSDLWLNIARRSWPERVVKWFWVRFDRLYRIVLTVFLRYSLQRYGRHSARSGS